MFKHSFILNLLFCFAMFSFVPPDGGDGGGAGDGGAGEGNKGGEGGGNQGAGGGAGGGTGGATPKFGDFIDPATGAFKPGWAKPYGLPETLEKKFTTPESLLKSHVSLEKMLGSQNKVVLPTAESTPEERAAFFGKLGRPDKPEGYELKMPDKIGDKLFPKELWNEAEAAEFSKLALDLNLTKEQAQKLAMYDAQRGLKAVDNQQMQQQAELDKATAELKTAWGSKFSENLAVANRASAQLWKAGEEPAALANNPAFIQAMFKVGQMISETPAAGARGTTHAQVDPQTEINTIRGDKTHPYHIKGHPNHDAAVAYVSKLYAQKRGEG